MEYWTEREAFIDTACFKKPQRIPLMTMGPRESTLNAWQKQGMDRKQEWLRQICSELQISYIFPKKSRVDHGINIGMIPAFEERILEHVNGHLVLQDSNGCVVEISDRYDHSYIRSARDFVTRKWRSFPVSNLEDFDSIRSRYNIESPGRIPEDFNKRCEVLKQRDYVASLLIPGPFWQMREWCGLENLCIMFIDNPDLIHLMIAFWQHFIDSLLERILKVFVPDRIAINEDMAYKGKSMISPNMAREFLLPVWLGWSKTARSAGVPVIDMDSDGYIGELIPLWIDAGITLCSPIEVAAGNDLIELRRLYHNGIAYTGGVDKRCMASTHRALEEEIARVMPVVREGGYIPGCDHGIPPDVPWANMKHFVRLVAEISGWL